MVSTNRWDEHTHNKRVKAMGWFRVKPRSLVASYDFPYFISWTWQYATPLSPFASLRDVTCLVFFPWGYGRYSRVYVRFSSVVVLEIHRKLLLTDESDRYYGQTHAVLPFFLWRQKEIEPVKDESAQRFKDLQEEFTIYEAARKDPKQASEQVAWSVGHAARFLPQRSSHAVRCSSFVGRMSCSGLTRQIRPG